MTPELETAKRKLINELRDTPQVHAAALDYLQKVEAYISWLEMESLQADVTIQQQQHQIGALDHNLSIQVDWTKKLMRKYLLT